MKLDTAAVPAPEGVQAVGASAQPAVPAAASSVAASASVGPALRALRQAKGLSLDGNRPAQTPAFAGTLTLGWRPAEGWQVAGTLRHVSAQFEDDLETDSLGAATTIDAFIAAPLAGKLSVVVRGENLTGEEIVTRNQGGSIDLGVPRTLWLGLRYGF